MKKPVIKALSITLCAVLALGGLGGTVYAINAGDSAAPVDAAPVSAAPLDAAPAGTGDKALPSAAGRNVKDETVYVLARADESMRRKKREQRPAAHAAIKDWIRSLTGNEVGEDERISDV